MITDFRLFPLSKEYCEIYLEKPTETIEEEPEPEYVESEKELIFKMDDI